MEKLKSNKNRAKFAVIFSWILLVFELFGLFALFKSYSFLKNALNGVEVDFDAFDNFISNTEIVATINMIFFFLFFVTFLMWFYRAYSNLSLRVNNLSSEPRWTVIFWFIPILFLYKPFVLMKELFVETNNYANDAKYVDEDSFSTSFLGWWWAAFVLSRILSVISDKILDMTQSAELVMTGLIIAMFSSLVAIVYYVLNVVLINKYSKLNGYLEDELI